MSLRDFVAKEYQEIAQDFMLNTPRVALFAGMGIGKTVSTLNLIDALYLTGTSDPVLVLGPLRVARDTWPDELAKWRHLQHLTISPIIGTPEERRAAIRKPAHIYTTNYEQLPWLVDYMSGRPWPFRTVVADESTRLKGFRLKQGGQRASALASIARCTDRWVNLTGTPAPNGLQDLWGQFWFMDFGQRLGLTYSGFLERWFRKKYSGFGIEPLPHAEKEIHQRIDDVTLAIRPKDWFALKDPIVRTVDVKLSDKVMKQYKQFELEMFAELPTGEEIEVFNAAALTNKCLQYASGAVYTDNPKYAEVHDAKLEALDSLVSESAGAPMLVAYQFRHELYRILKRFPQATDISKREGLEDFKAGKKQIGVAHPASMGHGIDGLQDVTNILVYFGHTWNLEHHQQILERIGPMRQLQSGYERPVWVYSIVASGTLDEEVAERHESKCTIQDALLAAMSRRSR